MIVGAVAVAVVVAAVVVVGGFIAYRAATAGPDAPVYDPQVFLDAAPSECDAGYPDGEKAEARRWGFGMGALNAWDEDEQRWTTPGG